MEALKCIYFWGLIVVVTIIGSSGSVTEQDANAISLEFITVKFLAFHFELKSECV